MVLINKKDGTIRFCLDYRKLNAITIKDSYPLPHIDDCVSSLGRSKYFTTFDLASGYWQIPMDPDTRHKAAFICHAGLFEPTRMAFGVTGGPQTFQRFMDGTLAGLKWVSCLVYLDDIIIFSDTFENHMKHIDEVFGRLAQAGLTLKPSKCFFCQVKVQYLGSQEAVAPNPKKIEAVIKLPTPNSVAQVHTFLGICCYYRHFIKNYAAIANPLYQLIRQDTEFIWTDVHERAFNLMKTMLTTSPILCHPDFHEMFIVQTDASDEGLGAV